jgi:hypothetical protein
MNQRLKAAAMTAGMLIICLSVTAFFHFLASFVTASMIPTILIVVGLIGCVYCIYSIFLAQIRYEDSLKRMVDKK